MQKSEYWQHKLSVYLHDPPHKCLSIQKHEQWAKEIAELVGCASASKQVYQSADMIASGLTRAATPGYSTDAYKNGAVDFISSPVLTHPAVSGSSLKLIFNGAIHPDQVHQSVLGLLAADLKALALTGDDEDRSRRIFNYLFFAFKKRLRNDNVGGLGAAWDLLPADTRMPDHPVWHHLALTSAMASAMREDGIDNVSLAVFSITPVQQFIAKARKLRDHWFGSVILSYLAFTGIRYIAAILGPDHIVYPSLHDQSLVDGWLGKEFGLENLLKERNPFLQGFMESGKAIASFPNKFVFIAPTSTAQEICTAAEAAVQAEWLRIAGLVKDFIGNSGKIDRLFEHQISDYWQYSFAAAKLPGIDDKEKLAALLHHEKWDREAETMEAFSRVYGRPGEFSARLYAAAHSLIQGVLASSKLKPTRVRKPQHGEKCPLCGEHEVLHALQSPEIRSAREYKDGVKEFWDGLRNRFNSDGSSIEIGKNERLCAVCCIKRFLPRVLKQRGMRDELLFDVAAGADSFPSTTGIAAHGYLSAIENTVGLSSDKRKRLIEALHEAETEIADDDASSALKTIIAAGREAGVEFTDRDKYYALLLMDGDKMGDLINGETVSACWGDVIHPELRKRYDTPQFKPEDDALRGRLQSRRTLNPGLHAAISDSLNSFARFAVAPLVANAKGRLIYAGGDDVCAMLPLDSALETADAIRKAYTAGFVRYTEGGAQPCGGESGTEGKLGVHFGVADGISISAAIVIAHHKEPLREVLRDAHTLLDGVAKKKAGRNAVAIRLRKRSGGDRVFCCKWDAANSFLSGETVLDSFRKVTDGAGDIFSSSLLYRLESLRDALYPMKDVLSEKRELVVQLFAYETGHSGAFNKAGVGDAARRLAGITLDTGRKGEWFMPEAAIIAGFLGLRGRR